MKKKFYIFGFTAESAEGITFEESIDGTVAEARNCLDNPAYGDGTYLILEDTSGIVAKTTVTPAPVQKVTFEPTRKRPRKEKFPSSMTATESLKAAKGPK